MKIRPIQTNRVIDQFHTAHSCSPSE